MKLVIILAACVVAASASASAVCISTVDNDLDGVYVYTETSECSIDNAVLNSDLDDADPTVGNPMTELARTDGVGWDGPLLNDLKSE